MAPTSGDPIEQSTKQNYKINQLYIRQVRCSTVGLCCANWGPSRSFTPLLCVQDFDACLELIDKVLEDTHNLCEFGLYVKALIKRQQGGQEPWRSQLSCDVEADVCFLLLVSRIDGSARSVFPQVSSLLARPLPRRSHSGVLRFLSASYSFEPTKCG